MIKVTRKWIKYFCLNLIAFYCFKELLFFTCVIGICSSAAIKNIQSEPASIHQENEVDGVNENQISDLETAEGRHFGPRVVVINKGYGGHREGYGGGYGGGCGCGGGHSHYHSHHRYYGKRK